jgi:ribose 5-phosphate isomerase A
VSRELEKQLAAEAAAAMVRPGMRVGLGTGSTVAYLLRALSHRRVDATYVASSPQTASAARRLGIGVEDGEWAGDLHLAIDGADQITRDGWLIKGGGGAHAREKVIAASAHRFVVIADSSKLVANLTPPVPLELMAFGIEATLRRVDPAVRRDGPPSPDGGVIADYYGDVADPMRLSHQLSSIVGVVAHGIFAPDLVSEILIGSKDGIRRTTIGAPS